MKLIRTLLLPVLFVAMWSLTGCNEEPITTDIPEVAPRASKLTLPAGAEVTNAVFKIYIQPGTEQETDVNVHKVLVPWAEATTNWDNFYGLNVPPAGRYEVPEVGFFDASDAETGYRSVNVTSLVQSWLADPTTNNGVLLDQTVAYPAGTDPLNPNRFIYYWSRNLASPPVLEVTYKVGNNPAKTVTEVASEDTYIWSREAEKKNIYGGANLLFQTKVLPLHEYTKHVLVKFDIESTPGTGCTLTPGYWKTHSEYGPAPYDNTWAQLPNGADTPFFLSGKTYYQVLWTPPAGNAYYNLSFHYIAAGLNFLNGADPSAAQAAYDAATMLFSTYTPAQIKALKGNNPLRAQFINLAGILGDYNEGLIGPGHCD